MRIVTVVGARPQFIKAAAVSRVIRDQHADQITEVLVHTGQHFDENMSQVFFDQLDIPTPQYNLEISGGSHGAMTGRMLEAIENVFTKEKPDWVLVYGDTNSTLAAALAAAKIHIPFAHIEAGLRSFNMRMPEEINRILTDRISTLLFCPTDTAVANLRAEGMTQGVQNTGDVMYDAALFYKDKAKLNSKCLKTLGLTEGNFALATCHREENTDNPDRLKEILDGLNEISSSLPVIFPIHPRTRKLVKEFGLEKKLKSFRTTDPLPFLDMIALEQAARVILTDSGGVQKEAFFYKVPCITMRDETEWVETVACNANCLVGASASAMIKAFKDIAAKPKRLLDQSPYGEGNAANRILQAITNFPLN
jgi:UDP-GlcNAc3NAcA epimerase